MVGHAIQHSGFAGAARPSSHEASTSTPAAVSADMIEQPVLVLGTQQHAVAVRRKLVAEGHRIVGAPTVDEPPGTFAPMDLGDHRPQRRDADAAGEQPVLVGVY